MIWVSGGLFLCFFVVFGFILVLLTYFVIFYAIGFCLVLDEAGRPSPF